MSGSGDASDWEKRAEIVAQRGRARAGTRPGQRSLANAVHPARDAVVRDLDGRGDAAPRAARRHSRLRRAVRRG